MQLKRTVLPIFFVLLLSAPVSAENGFREGGREIGQGFRKLGQATGSAFVESGKRVGEAFKRVAKVTGQTFRDAGRKTGEAFRKQ